MWDPGRRSRNRDETCRTRNSLRVVLPRTGAHLLVHGTFCRAPGPTGQRVHLRATQRDSSVDSPAAPTQLSRLAKITVRCGGPRCSLWWHAHWPSWSRSCCCRTRRVRNTAPPGRACHHRAIPSAPRPAERRLPRCTRPARPRLQRQRPPQHRVPPRPRRRRRRRVRQGDGQRRRHHRGVRHPRGRSV